LARAGRDTGGWAGVRHLLTRVAPTWASVPWYAAVLLGFPAANLAAARPQNLPGFVPTAVRQRRDALLVAVAQVRDANVRQDVGVRAHARRDAVLEAPPCDR
jgi:hypothetical protein